MTKTFTLQKRLHLSILVFSLMLISFSASALVAPSVNPGTASEKTTVAPVSTLNAEEFLALTPKKYRELTGEKLSLSQKIALKIAQAKVKKAIKNHEEPNISQSAELLDTSDFNIGGFVLGLVLPILGVIIAYLIGDPSVIKWAWIGFGIVAIIFLLTVIL